MSNFGFRELRLVSPWEPSFREANSAVGAAQVMQEARCFATMAEAVDGCALVVGTTAVGERELQHPLHTLSEAGELIRTRLAAAPVALVFGSEKSGLSNEEMSHCHFLLRIPTRDEHISMNLGQAVAVCLYELARASAQPVPAAKDSPAAAEDLERITEVLFTALGASGYTPNDQTALERARRMVYRLSLDANDARALLGMLRKMLWKIEHPEK